MLNRKIVLTCFAAVAAIGVALAPVAAAAKSHDGNGHSHKHGKHAHAHHKKHHHHKHAHHHKKHHKHHHWHHKKYYPVETETAYYSKPNYVYSKPAPSCTCLTKEYAPDGRVVFKDVCTKEMAVSAPGTAKAEADD